MKAIGSGVVPFQKQGADGAIKNHKSTVEKVSQFCSHFLEIVTSRR
jgi:hypothetical protein